MKQTLIIILFLLAPLSFSWAQQQDDELEALYDQYETQEVQRSEQPKATEKKPKDVGTISELGNLAPFEDIAVIQRRFLPRTKRLEMSLSGLVSTNNQFFNNIGVALKGAYYFTEKIAVEGSYLFMSSSEKDVTKGLKQRRIETASLVEPESYMGVALKWSPFYGKIAWFQEKIIPFDIYIAPGLGMTSTALGEDELTYGITGGQSFALSKSSAIRWDLTWNFYSATVVVDNNRQTQSQDDLLLMIGYSYYIPEATYR